jgi:hypothetical protein
LFIRHRSPQNDHGRNSNDEQRPLTISMHRS